MLDRLSDMIPAPPGIGIGMAAVNYKAVVNCDSVLHKTHADQGMPSGSGVLMHTSKYVGSA